MSINPLHLWNGTEVEDGLVVEAGDVGDAVWNQLQGVGDEFVQTVHRPCTILHRCQIQQLIPVLTPHLKQKESGFIQDSHLEIKNKNSAFL